MRYIDIVMEQPPGPDSQFIEVEDANGHSIRVGEWMERPDGYWALRLTLPLHYDPPEPPDPPGWEGGFAENH